MFLQNTLVGTVELRGIDESCWKVELTSAPGGKDIAYLRLKITAEQPLTPPQFSIAWRIPQKEIQHRWTPSLGLSKNLPPNWGGTVTSELAHSAPVMSLFGISGRNALTFAFSDACRKTVFLTGIVEHTSEIACVISCFETPEAPLSSYEAVIRLDTRPIFYARVLSDVSAWFASFPEYTPCNVPPHALLPVYSTWYSYHQDLFEDAIEKECAAAKTMGMESVIVDDGWQTEDNHGGYLFCGDWEASKLRFADMRKHVNRVHAAGMKYILWYSVPFVGKKSKAYLRFQGKYLYERETLGAVILDPRFPEVREHLIRLYETAVLEWDLDGLKLDFIDSFPLPPGHPDPAVAEQYAGRDFKTVPEAVDALLTEIMRRLRALKPDIMIEFRQSYIGPAIRKYGNLFRAADCPGDLLHNRVRTMDLRLFSGNTAVHSDMLTWNYEESVESAARQFLNILFSVPQISVRLAEIPESHRKMLQFWLRFWLEHREVLLHGQLTPLHPELNYPVIRAEHETSQVIVIYSAGQVAEFELKPHQSCYIVNASESDSVFLKWNGTPRSAAAFDACGEPAGPRIPLSPGLSEVKIPVSGFLRMETGGERNS